MVLDFEDNEPEWTKIDIDDSSEKEVLVELTKDEQIIVLSNKRNVYKSLDQGVTFEYERQISHLRYWGKRIKHWWQNGLIVLRWLFVVRVKLWWLTRN